LSATMRSRTERRRDDSSPNLSQQAGEAGGSLSQETLARADSSPDNDGTGQHRQMAWVWQARPEGVRKKPTPERSSSKSHQLEPGGSGLGSGAHPRAYAEDSPSRIMSSAGEATVKDCGVTVAMSQGHSWTPHRSIGSRVNVGTIPAAPFPASSQPVGGKARRQLMPSGWGGGAVVVRGRESRPHGEGPQRDCSLSANRGVRW
jgi:hypothetical protein